MNTISKIEKALLTESSHHKAFYITEKQSIKQEVYTGFQAYDFNIKISFIVGDRYSLSFTLTIFV
jgi:hypothetical protein